MEFFATDDDHVTVLRWLFAENDVEVFETWSRRGEELRRFVRADDLVEALRLDGRPRRGSVQLSVWAPSTGGSLSVQRTGSNDEPDRLRHVISGWGLMALQLEPLTGDALRPSRFVVNSEKRALAWEPTSPADGPVTAWDWLEVTRVFRRISGWVRRQAAGESDGRPVLPGARAAAEAGARLAAS